MSSSEGDSVVVIVLSSDEFLWLLENLCSKLDSSSSRSLADRLTIEHTAESLRVNAFGSGTYHID
jgi:hypothetical protein